MKIDKKIGYLEKITVMTQPMCSVLLQRSPRSGQCCGKEAKFSVDCEDTPLYLCKYHSTRYLQGKPVLFCRMNHLLNYGEPVFYDRTQGWSSKWTGNKVAPCARFLPDDCWKVIVKHLPDGEQYLAKFVCKLWHETIGNKCPRMDLSQVHYRYINFKEIADYLGSKNIGNIDSWGIYLLPKNLEYLLDKGCLWTDELFVSLVSWDLDKMMCLLDRGYIPPPNIQERLVTYKTEIFTFLRDNDINIRIQELAPNNQ